MDDNQELNNLHQPLISSDLRAASSDPTPEPQKPKQGITKKTFALSIIFTVLLTASITSVVWFLNMNNQKTTNVPQISPSTSTSSTEEDVEVELADATIKDRLNYIFGAIHNRYDSDFVSDSGKPVSANFFMNYVSSLYKNGEYDNLQKLWTTLFALYHDNEFQSLASFSQLNNKDFTPYFGMINDNENFRRYVTAVSAEKVEEKYKNLFGNVPTHQDVNEICGGFRYDADAKVYYYGQDNGCGGTDTRGLSLYRTKYSSDAENAYIYAKTATVVSDGENCVVYSDVFPDVYDRSNNTIITNVKEYYGECHITPSTPTSPSTIDFDLSTAKLPDFAEYRFVFTKAPDGSYYFDSVEKL